MTRRDSIATIVSHAKVFAKHGGTLEEYRQKHIDHWRELEYLDLAKKIFKPIKATRIRKSGKEGFFNGEFKRPTLPQQWYTPVLDLNG